MSVYVRGETRREAPVPRSGEDVLLRQKQVSSKVHFLLICKSEKCHFCVRKFRRYVSCEKWVHHVSGWWRGKRMGHNLWSCSFLLNEWMEWMDSRLPVSFAGGAVAKTMWHWYRKWTFSGSLAFYKLSLFVCLCNCIHRQFRLHQLVWCLSVHWRFPKGSTTSHLRNSLAVPASGKERP